ncbi:hypothetical protein [Mongoliibacter ruber]|uniref:DUF3575 domain-containing protein n=1 Tax=Mongoliibacter ruber TaxID=1750599 RepID=A0A2T0WNV4_9BACT|nr:hypothetical protein [Mongoliibacter ruber]PRY88383.1 hypothetical protein CLW00_10434 [Mongoliibacter ruber]
MYKKFLIALTMFAVVGIAEAQVESETSETEEKVSLRDYVVPKKSALGIRFGYFNSIAASYQQFITDKSAIDVNFGWRPSGGFVRWAEPFTRLGGHATYQRMYPLDVRKDGTIHFFWSVGWHAGVVEWVDVEDSRGLQTGPLVGVGLDLRFEKYSINLGVLPGWDLPGGNLDQAAFFMNKGSGVAVRLLF